MNSGVGPNNSRDKNKLMKMLVGVNLSIEGEDVPVWELDKTESYSVSSIYRLINDGGLWLSNAKAIWSTKCPLKI